MQDTKELQNNRLRITGRIVKMPTYTHTVKTSKGDVRYCNFSLKIERKSGTHDIISVSTKEELLVNVDLDKIVEVIGEIRTTNIETHLKVYGFATEINNCDKEGINEFEAVVYTCKKPNYRKTPGGKQITDMTLACIRSYKSRSDYFPTIVWGEQAKAASVLEVGKQLYIKGRLQSRNYIKNVNGEPIEKIAYEVSVNNFEVLD